MRLVMTLAALALAASACGDVDNPGGTGGDSGGSGGTDVTGGGGGTGGDGGEGGVAGTDCEPSGPAMEVASFSAAMSGLQNSFGWELCAGELPWPGAIGLEFSSAFEWSILTPEGWVPGGDEYDVSLNGPTEFFVLLYSWDGPERVEIRATGVLYAGQPPMLILAFPGGVEATLREK